MKKAIISTFGLMVFMLVSLVSCEKDNMSSSSSDDRTSKKTKPSISVLSTATTTTSMTVNFKVKVGHNEDFETDVIMYYGTSSNNLSQSRTCVFQKVEGRTTVYQYYKGQVSGFSGGTRVYFKGVATNGGGSDATSVQSVLIKR